MRFETLEEAKQIVQDTHGNGETLRFEHTHDYLLYTNFKAYRGDVLVADFGWNMLTGRFDGDFHLDEPKPEPVKVEKPSIGFVSMDDYYDMYID